MELHSSYYIILGMWKLGNKRFKLSKIY